LRAGSSQTGTAAGLVYESGEIKFRFLLVVVELAFEIRGFCGRPRSKRHLEEAISASGLHVLFVEKIEEQILVSLDESLGVDLSVLELLVAISLDTLEERRQSLLLFLPEQSLLLLNDLLNELVHLLVLFLL
jgi:hypothetical protein